MHKHDRVEVALPESEAESGLAYSNYTINEIEGPDMINWDADCPVRVSSVLSVPGVTSQVKEGLLVGPLGGSENDGGLLAFDAVELEASGVDVKVR